MIAVLSNVNMEPLKDYSERKRELIFFPYSQMIQPLLDKQSRLYGEQIDTLIMFIDWNEFIKDYNYTFLNQEHIHLLQDALKQVLQAIAYYNSNAGGETSNIKIMINDVVFSPKTFATFVVEEKHAFLVALEDKFNADLFEFCSLYPNVVLAQWKQETLYYGYNNLYSKKYWYLGRIALSTDGFCQFSRMCRNMLNAYMGQTKKILVLDLDNTLWGGIIGEDGLDGILLSEDGIGKAYRDFQKNIKALKQIGIVLCINSKNNTADVLHVFDKHPMMVLHWDDFALKQINWENKVQNLQTIAQELNVGLDAMVFIDDNPAERKLIAEYLPMVVVPEFPTDAVDLSEWFINQVIYPYFPKMYVTTEDVKKGDQYKALVRRNDLMKKLDMDDFVDKLGIHLQLSMNQEGFSQRIAQLTQKTNQFNITIKRFSHADILAMLKSPMTDVFSLTYSDNYGDEGIIGAAVVTKNGQDIFLEVFLLSCRVLGRKVEFAFFYEILKKYRSYRFVYVDFNATTKNMPAKRFIEQLPLVEYDTNRYKKDVNLTINEMGKMNTLEVDQDE